MSAVARLQTKGYTEITYEKLKEYLFIGLSDALKEQGMSREATATLMGQLPRTFFSNLDRYKKHQYSENTKPSHLYWDILLYVHQHPKVTRREILDAFADSQTESQINLVLSTIKALRHEQRLFEGGGRGNNMVYYAPVADLPDNDPATIEPALKDHIKAVGETIVASCEKELFNRDNGSLLLTINFDVSPDGLMATELQDLVEEFISKLRLLWERTEADLSRERTKRITIYIGKSC
jgi:hypothetical protein